jgi:glycosyltransferase involved in cell wall biosynthesis
MSPRLSLVVASVNGAAALADCIASFAQQPLSNEIEIVIAESSTGDEAGNICKRYPNVRHLHFEERKSIPELRAIGLLVASAPILAMTEDHCLAAPDWIESALAAHAGDWLVIGGAVENSATERVVDWAVYFCEYGRFMLPVELGPTNDLPGPNVSYKRAAFELFRDLLEPANWEPFWHWRLMERGVTLINDPRLVVYHHKHFTFGGFLRERYHYARSFAGRRIEGAPWPRRAFFTFGAPLLPPLLLARIMRRVLRKRRHRREFLTALPYITCFTLSWSLGELIGYLFGPGNSQAQIE